MKSKKSKKRHNLSYDVIIVGGGIAGLYTAYNLIKKNKKASVLLVESSDILGGRIYTVNKDGSTFEAGAARFHSNQYRIMNLVKELKLEDKLIPINNDIKFVPYPQDKYLKYNYFYIILNVDNIINEIVKLINNGAITQKEMINNTFIDIIHKKLNLAYPDIKEIFTDAYEYWSEISIMNALDALQLIKRDFVGNHKYYVLRGGMTQIIEELEKKIKNKVTIIKNYPVKQISKNKTIDTTFTINNKYTAEKLIMAIPKHALTNIKYFSNNRRISQLLNTIEESPLLRIYAKYPKTIINHHTWFDKFTSKIITTSKLKYIIPINHSDGIIMISYTDGKNTKDWPIDNETALKKKVIAETNKSFPDLEVPEPLWIKPCYWKHGAGYWKKGHYSENYIKKIIQPTHNEELYICGENYSKHQSWIEGALQTSDFVNFRLKFDV